MSHLLLTGGRVVTSSGTSDADVLVRGGRIEAIGRLGDLPIAEAERVDVTGRLLLPGGVDVHTHIDSPMMGTTTSDDFETGTRAAACGGTTTLVDFAMQLPGQSLTNALAGHHAKAEGKAVVDYGFHMCVTDLYEGATGEFAEIVQSGVSSFKVFMAYRGSIMLHDGDLFEVLRTSGGLGGQVCVHAESGDVIDRLSADLVAAGRTGPGSHEISRPPSTEIEAVERAIKIARMADSPLYFVHLSTEGAVEAVAEARSKEWAIAGETCTHYLTLDRSLYDAPGFEAAKVVLTPPLRTQEHRDALWRGLRAGTLGVVSSDHCPFCLEEKRRLGSADFRAIPNGGPGVEHRFIVMYAEGVRAGRISLEKFVDLVAGAPARQFGLPSKGAITTGADADIVVLDPEGTTTITAETQNQRMDYTPYEGWTLPGAIESVYSRGELIARDGRYVGVAGRGRFLARTTQ
ncbi:dihydropyrimidinase [Amycolatopsis jiangsuensis]|uniref:Dihydropyrimidinase n=1 Tax=Amycolatopsis jiangsuensis TaxID=1181879 RepID=A0A840IS52_9PSEU|nr:dihydropyrimidinase [Amycolatopsis jiangsuensis]MBB4683844.1 dihydropyrimidinase [Amycolatopsis jiangsuensis]